MTELQTLIAVMSTLILGGIAFTIKAFRPGGLYNPVKPKDFTELDYMPENNPEKPQVPTATIPEETTLKQPVSSEKQALLWATPKQAWHSTRVLCDEAGLTYDQKNIVCACIFRESEFNNNAVGRNKDPKTGKVWSTDWGIVQVNDTKGWHIGKGLRFSSVQDVLDNPEMAVKWMISVMKETGKLQPWASYTTKAYAQFLPKSSPMWKLKVL